MRHLATLAILLALGGCEHPGGYDYPGGYDRSGARRAPSANEMIWTDADTYSSGTSPISMRLTNRTGRTLGYNLCRSQLQRTADNEWRTERSSLAEVCTAELRGLRPGQSATFVFRPGNVRNGTYRIRTELNDPQGGPPVEAVSNPFSLMLRDRSD